MVSPSVPLCQGGWTLGEVLLVLSLLLLGLFVGHQAGQEQWQRLADLKQKTTVECQLLQAGAFFSPLVPHSVLHHHPFPGQDQPADDPEPAYDTLSLESSDSLETNLSVSGNSACSPDNASRSAPFTTRVRLELPTFQALSLGLWVGCAADLLLNAGHIRERRAGRQAVTTGWPCSGSGADARKIEEMEKLLKEAQAERTRLMESRVRAGEKSRDGDPPKLAFWDSHSSSAGPGKPVGEGAREVAGSLLPSEFCLHPLPQMAGLHGWRGLGGGQLLPRAGYPAVDLRGRVGGTGRGTVAHPSVPAGARNGAASPGLGG